MPPASRRALASHVPNGPLKDTKTILLSDPLSGRDRRCAGALWRGSVVVVIGLTRAKPHLGEEHYPAQHRNSEPPQPPSRSPAVVQPAQDRGDRRYHRCNSGQCADRPAEVRQDGSERPGSLLPTELLVEDVRAHCRERERDVVAHPELDEAQPTLRDVPARDPHPRHFGK